MGWILKTDGLCEPRNPKGKACFGWALFDSETIVLSGFGYIGEGEGMTNNVAEYYALIRGLYHVKKTNRESDLIIQTDSKLVVEQVNLRWKCNVEALIELRNEARDMLRGISAKLEWIPREQNEVADKLSRTAYEQATKGLLKPRRERLCQ